MAGAGAFIGTITFGRRNRTARRVRQQRDTAPRETEAAAPHVVLLIILRGNGRALPQSRGESSDFFRVSPVGCDSRLQSDPRGESGESRAPSWIGPDSPSGPSPRGAAPEWSTNAYSRWWAAALRCSAARGPAPLPFEALALARGPAAGAPRCSGGSCRGDATGRVACRPGRRSRRAWPRPMRAASGAVGSVQMAVGVERSGRGARARSRGAAPGWPGSVPRSSQRVIESVR